jgi:hypothetical protein
MACESHPSFRPTAPLPTKKKVAPTTAETRIEDVKKTKRDCLEGESNSHLRITQAELGHILDMTDNI